MADADLDVLRLQVEGLCAVLAITLRVPVPISCTAQLATMRPPLIASSTEEPVCQR